MASEIVVVIDGDGRGSALVDAYARSEHVKEIIAIPGNDLMQSLTDKPVHTYPDLKTTSVSEIVEICKRTKISLVDVAQDNAVAVGLVDRLMENNINAFGPTEQAGEIEWSKVFGRRFGRRHGLPQPDFWDFNNPIEAINFLENQEERRWFVKADGLAEGKGVLPAKSNGEAMRRVIEIGRFGDASNRFLIEEWLQGDDEEGEEFSSFYICDGRRIKRIDEAQDYKREANFDEGENTGGTGCSTPPLSLDQDIRYSIEKDIFEKTIRGLADEGREYKGVLYLGGMLIKRNGITRPYVIEFNARWGDPEAQVILPGLTSDLFEIGMAVSHGDIRDVDIRMNYKSRIVVAGMSRGYPRDYESVKGKRIYGLDDAWLVDGVRLYGAGVRKVENAYYAQGGRLFYIVAEGSNIIEARRKGYEAMSLVSIEGNNLHYRTDIGWRDVQKFRTH